jgi:hypothetical protein
VSNDILNFIISEAKGSYSLESVILYIENILNMKCSDSDKIELIKTFIAGFKTDINEVNNGVEIDQSKI